MIRASLIHAPLVALLLCAMPLALLAQGTGKPASAKPAAFGKTAPRKEIFCSNMKTGQLCPDATAEILGLKGAQAEAWKVIVRKYNLGADSAATQLQKDSAAKLTPEQMEVLKAWFAVGWNEEINEILYKRNLDDINKADTQGLSTKKPEEEHEH